MLPRPCCTSWISVQPSRASGLRFFTPYHYYNAPRLLGGSTLDAWFARDVVILLTATIVLYAAAFRAYAERDV